MHLFMLISLYLTLSERCLAYSLPQSAPVAADLKKILGEHFKHVFVSGDGGCNAVLAGKEQVVQNGVAEAFYLAKVSAISMALIKNKIRKNVGSSKRDTSKPDPRISRVLKTIMGLDLEDTAKSQENRAGVNKLQNTYMALTKLASIDSKPPWALACARDTAKTSMFGKTYLNPTYVNGLVSENPVKVITSSFRSSKPKFPISESYYFSGLRAYWWTQKVSKGPCYGQNTLALPHNALRQSTGTGNQLTSYKSSIFVVCPSWYVRPSRPDLEGWNESPLVKTMKVGTQRLSIEKYVGLSSVFFKGLMRMANPHLKDYHRSYPDKFAEGFVGCQKFQNIGHSKLLVSEDVQEDVNCLYYLALALTLGVDVDTTGNIISDIQQNRQIANMQLRQFGEPINGAAGALKPQLRL